MSRLGYKPPVTPFTRPVYCLPDGRSMSLLPPKLTQNTNPVSTKEPIDGVFYCRAYKDIKSNVSPASHYHSYGKAEDRLPSAHKFWALYPNYDQETYIRCNPDLAHMSPEALMSHFHHNGRKEGRIYQNINLEPEPILDPTAKLAFEQEIKSKKIIVNSKLSKVGYQYLDNANIATIDLTPPVESVCRMDSRLKELLANRDSRPVYLVMAEWGYPPFGGGECWLMDTMKWLQDQGFACYYIYFYDHLKASNFDQIGIIKTDNGTFIQFTQNMLQLLQFVKLLNPKVISHQGFNRMKYIKIANLLEKPFVTGFCFWADILKTKSSLESIDPQNAPTPSTPNNPYNRDMMNKILIGDPDFKTICESSTYVYACGQFVTDVVRKVHGFDLDIINTITDESHYKLSKNELMKSHKSNIYVTVVNICGLKGGNILESLINNTSLQIPFMLIDSQGVGGALNQKLEQLIKRRNRDEGSVKSIYVKGPVTDMPNIYRKTKILLIPTLVDETFCRVGYEGMMNCLPILSTSNGNLKYLLKDYAEFLSEDPLQWAKKINEIYFDSNYLETMRKRPKLVDSEDGKTKFIEQIMKCVVSPSHSYFDAKHIGIFCPWGDQGLGIQCREYYDIFRKLGFVIHIFSFSPYHGKGNNLRLQTDPKEWDYPNIYYSSSHREDVKIDEVIDFIHRTRIKKMVIVETCFNKVFDIARLCRLLSISVYAIPNLETMRKSEISRHDLFDKIICNNQMTYELLNIYYPQKAELMGFRILNKNYINDKIWNRSHYSFFCIGGMNALTRKNIDKIAVAFKELEIEKKIGNFKLYVYIQGVEIPPDYQRYSSSNFIITVGSLTYREISQLYQKHDIFIHMGDHEGLGLGLYESIVCGTPVLTIDTPPNNEIIKENNGWVIPCTYTKLTDNAEGIVKKAVITVRDIKDKLKSIIGNYNRKQAHDLVTKDYLIRFPIWQYSETVKKIFS